MTALRIHEALLDLPPECWLAIMQPGGELEAWARSLPRTLWPSRRARQVRAGHEDLRWVLGALPTLVDSLGSVARALQQVKPQLIVTHSSVDFLAVLRFWPRRPLWVAQVGSDVALDLRLKLPRLEWLWKPLLRLLYAGPDHWVVTSQGLGQSLTSELGVPSQRISVIGNPVDSEKLQLLAREPLPGDVPERFVMGVGRLIPTKGFELLLESVARLPLEKRPAVVLLGEGPLREALEQQARRRGVELRMPGFEPNPWRYMVHAQAVIVTSLLEGFSNVCVEAQALNAPLLAVDCPHGPRELLAPECLVPRDATSLANRLSWLLAQQDSVGQGPQRAGRFTPRMIGRAYRLLFERLLDNKLERNNTPAG